MSIASYLRIAALGPTPSFPSCADSWVGDGVAWHAVERMADGSPLLLNMTDAQRRMFLLFCAHAAEDEGK